MSHNYQSAWTIFKKSRAIVVTNWKLFGLIYIFPLIGAAVTSYDRLRHVNNASPGWSNLFKGILLGNNSHTFGESAMFVTVIAVLSFLSGLALAVAATRYAQGRKPDLKQVFSELMDKGIRLVLLTVLSGILTLVGFFLLIIPGIFVLGRLYLAQYILINENTGVFDAIEQSWHLTKGRMWTTYSLILLTILFATTAVIPVTGSLIASVLALLFGIGPALRYFELKHPTK